MGRGREEKEGGLGREGKGLSIADSQAFLLKKRPKRAKSEEKRLFSQAKN